MHLGVCEAHYQGGRRSFEVGHNRRSDFRRFADVITQTQAIVSCAFHASSTNGASDTGNGKTGASASSAAASKQAKEEELARLRQKLQEHLAKQQQQAQKQQQRTGTAASSEAGQHSNPLGSKPEQGQKEATSGGETGPAVSGSTSGVKLSEELKRKLSSYPGLDKFRTSESSNLMNEVYARRKAEAEQQSSRASTAEDVAKMSWLKRFFYRPPPTYKDDHYVIPYSPFQTLVYIALLLAGIFFLTYGIDHHLPKLAYYLLKKFQTLRDMFDPSGELLKELESNPKVQLSLREYAEYLRRKRQAGSVAAVGTGVAAGIHRDSEGYFTDASPEREQLSRRENAPFLGGAVPELATVKNRLQREKDEQDITHGEGKTEIATRLIHEAAAAALEAEKRVREKSAHATEDELAGKKLAGLGSDEDFEVAKTTNSATSPRNEAVPIERTTTNAAAPALTPANNTAAASPESSSGDRQTRPRQHDRAASGDLDPLCQHHDPSPMTLYEMLKTLATWTVFPIAPLRAMAIVPLLCACWFFSRLSLIGLDTSIKNVGNLDAVPRARWRRLLLKPAAWIARLALFVCGFYWISVKGKPADALTAPIVVSNHVSIVDPIALYAMLDAPMFISKAAVVNVPLLSSILLANSTILVDRKSPTSRSDTQKEVNRRAAYNDELRRAKDEGERVAEALTEATGRHVDPVAIPEPYPHLVIFPEGTTTDGSALIEFKLGAFRPQVPVQPVVFRYHYSHFSPSYAGKRKNGVILFLRLISQFYNSVEMEYLPVVQPVSPPERFAAVVRQDMADTLGVPVCNQNAY